MAVGRYLAGASLVIAVALAGCQSRDEGAREDMARQQPLGQQATGTGGTGGAQQQQQQQAQAGQGQDRELIVAGTLAEASQQSVRVNPADGEVVELQVNEQTEITWNGQESSLQELPQGTNIRAEFSYENGQPVATKIEAAQDRTQLFEQDRE